VEKKEKKHKMTKKKKEEKRWGPNMSSSPFIE
jgi:hypothetical protein